MKRILIISGAVFALLLAIAAIIPFLVPKSVYRAQVERAATEALQRDVILTGDVSISLLPRLAASVGGLTVANPEGFDDPYFIEAGALRGSVKWLPLLGRRVEVQELTFVDARVSLHRLEDGRANWEFAPAAPPRPADAAPAEPPGFRGGIAQASLRNASLFFRDDAEGQRFDLSKLDLSASMSDMNQPFRLKADGVFEGQNFTIDADVNTLGSLMANAPTPVDVRLETAFGRAGFDGTLRLGDTPELDGSFTANSPGLTGLAEFLGLEMPYDLAQIGRLEAAGTVSGPADAMVIDIARFTQNSRLAESRFSGQVKLGPELTLAGDFSASIPDVSALARFAALDLPAASALERLNVSGSLAGPVDALSFDNLDVAHDGRLLTARYQGAAALAGPGRLAGRVEASSQQLRALLEALDVSLEPGATLQRFRLSGNLAGSFTDIAVNDLDLTLDDIAAKGTAGIDLSGERPRLTGRLDFAALDLSPFLAPADQEARPPQPLTAWSKDKLDLAGLNAADADLEINASRLTLGSVELTDAALAARVDAGRLTADLTRFSAFGGNWSGQLTADASDPVPAFGFRMQGNSVAMSSLLGTLAGFDRLSGDGMFRIDATARGGSIDEIIRGLNGEAATNLSEGALQGLNVGQLVRSASSLQQALTTGTLNNLDFSNVLAPAAETDFTQFETVLKIENGVANINLMKLLSPVLGVDGTGQINLGGQSLDIRLATAIDRSGQGTGSTIQLNGIPVPVRLSGRWDQLRVSPDFSGVQAALQAELGGRLRDELTGRTGGSVDSIIGGIIGGQAPRPEGDTAPEGTDQATPPPASPQQRIEDAAEQAARDALGGLLGRRSAQPPADAPPPENE